MVVRTLARTARNVKVDQEGRVTKSIYKDSIYHHYKTSDTWTSSELRRGKSLQTSPVTETMLS